MKYTILAIDDEEICLEVIELALQSDKFHLEIALGGLKAIEIFKSQKFKIDIVLLDLMMPDMSGIDVLKYIKSQDFLKDIPIILQTGSSNDLELDKAKEIGITTYVRKPYDCDDLNKALDDVIRSVY